jgi:hypothetical protein
MEWARDTLGGALRGTSPRRLAALVATAVFAGLVAWGGADAARDVGTLGERRADAIAARSDGAEVVGSAGSAFRSFRATLSPGERFALVFAPGTSVDDRGAYRLLALSYLYPAIAVEDERDAQAVMVFGVPSDRIRSMFAETGTVDGIWLGHRA